MINSRIREARRQKGLSQQEIADQMKVSKTAVSKWESGENEPKDLDILSSILGVNTKWLREGKGEKYLIGDDSIKSSRMSIAEWETITDEDEEFVTVPVLDIELSAGDGRENGEVEEEYTIPFRAYTLKKMGIPVDKTKVVRVSGDSMAPRLFDNDALSIDMSDTRIKDGKIYAIRIGNVQKVKVLIRNSDGTVTLRSFNPEFEDEIISTDRIESGEFQVLGRVWWSSSLYD